MDKTVYSPLGQTFDDYLRETGRHELVHSLARKKIAAFKAAQDRKRKLLAARKKTATKKKNSSLTAAVIKFAGKQKSVSKRNPVAKYAKGRSGKTPKKV